MSIVLDRLSTYIKWQGKPVTTSKEHAFRLPNELWIHVLAETTRPTVIIGDESCPSDEIERYLNMRASYVTTAAAGYAFQKNKRRLGAVCRLWRQLVNAIMWEEWIVDVSNVEESTKRLKKNRNSSTSPLIPRLNVKFHDALKLDHSHPVSSLTLVASGLSSFGPLSSVIPYPSSLYTLHLSLKDVGNLEPGLLDPLADPSIPLLTLSLTTSQYGVFYSPLTFPHLTTLSIYLLPRERHVMDGSPTRWHLPSIVNLSIGCPIAVADTSMNMFIHHLFVKNLRALRLIWPYNVGVDTSAGAFWRHLPKLEVLATEFAALLYDRSGKTVVLQDTLLQQAWGADIPLRHLIQNGYAKPGVFVPGLVKAMKHCHHLDTITISPASPDPSKEPSQGLEDYIACRRLEKICQSRGIRILDEEGLEIKDLVKSSRLGQYEHVSY